MVDTKMVAPKGSGPCDSDTHWDRLSISLPFAFHGLQAPSVKRQQFGHMLFGLGPELP